LLRLWRVDDRDAQLIDILDRLAERALHQERYDSVEDIVDAKIGFVEMLKRYARARSHPLAAIHGRRIH
jgi:hypothetical protein